MFSSYLKSRTLIFLVTFFIIRPHCSTTCYVDAAAFCYSVVRMSVCQDREPRTNDLSDRHVVWDVNSGWPKKPCIRWGQDRRAKEEF